MVVGVVVVFPPKQLHALRSMLFLSGLDVSAVPGNDRHTVQLLTTVAAERCCSSDPRVVGVFAAGNLQKLLQQPYKNFFATTEPHLC